MFWVKVTQGSVDGHWVSHEQTDHHVSGSMWQETAADFMVNQEAECKAAGGQG